MEDPNSGDNREKESFMGSIKKMLTELSGRGSEVTEKELISMVNEGHEQGVIEGSKAQMINNIIDFGGKEAQDIMTHRKQIIAFDSDITLGEAFKLMIAEQRSRYPVYEGNIDHITGILYLKDAVRLRETMDESILDRPVRDIEGLLREAMFIPETRHIDVIFRDMRAKKLQMVIVIDEYGQCVGLVAMEDILEEIVGSIFDEYDKEETHIRKVSPDKYVIEGLTPLEEIEKELGIGFDEDDIDTLNGFLVSRMDRIPENGEEFETEHKGFVFRVLSVQNHIVETALATRIAE